MIIRPRLPGRHTLIGLLIAVCLCATKSAQAQVITRDTTARADSAAILAVRADSIRADSLRADSIAQVRRHYPALPVPSSAGFAFGDYSWDRDALLREGAVSLIDLLERIPSIAAFRSGLYVQPEAASAFGGTVGRVEVVLDGFVLDPLAAPVLDLAQIPLGQLRAVRVERRLGLLRIHLFSDHPFEGRPYTRVEAGIGQPDADMFRGIFLVPHVVVGPLGLGIERLDTDGTEGAEPANIFNGWGKWTWTNGRRGLQFELMRGTLQREAPGPWPVERLRQDMILRARNEFAPGIVADAYVGRTEVDDDLALDEDEDEDSVALPRIERKAMQAGVRVGLQRSILTLGGTFRYRDADLLPRTEFILDGDVAAGPLRVRGEVGRASWESDSADLSNAGDALYSSASAMLGRIYGFSAFGEITNGDRGAPAWGDTAASSYLTTRKAWRAGVSLDLGSRASGSIAYVNIEHSPQHPFGLPFDTIGSPRSTAPARGIEAWGRFVIFPGWLAIESQVTDWQELGNFAYLPTRTWRTTLESHMSPLPSGNLEILARLEGAHRSPMLAWDPEDPNPFADPISMPSFTTFNAYLHIRVIDVRAFLRYEDLTGADPQVLPGRIRRGPRIFYGVKWNLWN